MMPCFLVLAVFILTDIALAQTRKPQREEVDIPLPITSPRTLMPGQIDPLTPKQKMSRAFQNVFYPQALANRALLAGIDYIRDSPEEWERGGTGYGMRLGNRMGSLAVRNAIQLSTDLAFKLEPRYDQCNCTGFKSRTTHAWKRLVIARTDVGNSALAVSDIAGSFGTPFVTRLWYPDRYNTTGSKLGAGASTYALRGVSNMVREFWPEIRKKLHLPKMGR